MTINASGWRPEMGAGAAESAGTYTGNRALMLEEALIFEIGDGETTGVDLAAPSAVKSRLAGLERNRPIGLPGLSEPETMRHYTRLSRQNYAIDLGLFPLGSCTMKHNPRLNEKIARFKYEYVDSWPSWSLSDDRILRSLKEYNMNSKN